MAFLVRALSGKSNSKLGLLDYTLISVSLSAASLWVFPQTALAKSSPTPPTPILAFEIQSQNQIQDTILQGLVPSPAVASEQQNKIEILRAWLASKNSPMEEYAPLLLMQDKKIMYAVLSVAHAESNLCRRQLGNNCWGIGGAKYHRFYPSFAEGIVDAAVLIKKYHVGGLNTPEKMMRRWVGWHNYSWVRANNQIIAQLHELDI